MFNSNTSTKPDKKVGERISDLLTEHGDAPILLMLSGGSALSVLEHVRLSAINQRVTLSLIDERVGVKEADSNAWQLVQTKWFQKSKVQGAQLNVLEQGALKKWRAEHEGGKIITLLGMGTDGHIAGILPMPEDEDLFNTLFIHTDNWVTEYVHENTDNPFKERVTITGKFLTEAVDHIVLYAVGESKCPRLNNLKKEYAPHIEPIDILTNLESVNVYTDCKA